MNVGKAAVKEALLQASAQSNSAHDAERATTAALFAIESFLKPKATEVIRRAMFAGGKQEARTLNARSGLRASKTPVIDVGDFRFDVTNAEALAWAEQYAGVLVTNVTRETEAAIRTIITRAFREQISVADSARLIRASVGLSEPQALAVANLYDRLLASPGQRLYAGRVPIRVPKDGITQTQLDKVVKAYSDRLIRQRARTIARTEVVTAAHQGQLRLWAQAVQSGLLSGQERMRWLTDDPCPMCQALADETAKLFGTFELEDGSTYETPPAHPNCRCTLVLDVN